MKKFFTSVLASAFLIASGESVYAQQSFSKADQDVIKKEVLPAVFEQIKEQAGIDILGWAHPQFSDASISGFPVFDSGSTLRSAGAKNIQVQPDSIIVYLPSSVPSFVPAMLGEYVKVTFAGYDKKEIPVGNYNMELNLPDKIIVASPKMSLVTFNFSSTLEEGKILPFTMDVDMTVDNDLLLGIFKDKKLDLISLVAQQSETGSIDANLNIEAGLKNLVGTIGDITKSKVSVPDGFLLSVNVGSLFYTSNVPCSLYAVTGKQKLPMGDAVIGLNLTGGFPLSYVDVTSYEKGQADEWEKLWMDAVDVDNENVKRLDVHKYEYKDSQKKDSTYQRSTAIQATSGLFSLMQSMPSRNIAQSLVTRVANQMLADNLQAGQLSIWHYNKENASAAVQQVFDASMDLVIGKHGLTDVVIKMTEYADDDDEKKNDISFVKLSFTGEKRDKIKVEYILDDEKNKASVIAYISSNVLNAVTSNEQIATPSWSITPSREGIRVRNIEKAAYQVISMTGATVSSGTIAGDVVIPTSSLAKGKYIFVVNANGMQQAVKFIH